jgi:hypothetical protein
MLVVYDLIIPPNTLQSIPLSAVIKPTVGLLTGIEVYFRDGCLDAVGVRILDGGRQIAPFPSGWLRDNNRHITWSENRQLEGPPYVLVVEGYSLALDWPHTITFKFMMEL